MRIDQRNILKKKLDFFTPVRQSGHPSVCPSGRPSALTGNVRNVIFSASI